MYNQLVNYLALYGITGFEVTLFLLLASVVSIFLVIGVLTFLRKLIKRYFLRKKYIDQAVLQVLVPKYSAQEAKEGTAEGPKSQQELAEKIATMEAVFSNIGALSAQKGMKYWFKPRDDHFSFEIVVKEELIYFYVVCRKHDQQFIEEQVTAQFPQAVVEEVEDYNIFHSQGIIVGKMLSFKRAYIFPIKTYRKLETDSLNSLTNSLSEVDGGSGAAIQFVCRSANPKWRKWSQKTAERANQGTKLSDAVTKGGGGAMSGLNTLAQDLWDLLFGKAKKEDSLSPETKKEHRLSQQEQEAIKGIEEKAAKAGLDVNIRIIVSAPTKAKADQYLNNISNSFGQFNIYNEGNAFSPSKISQRKLIKNFIYRIFNEKKRMVLNTEEMTSVFHFPMGHTQTPNIVWLQSRTAAPPTNAPKEGFYLGDNIYRGVKTPIYMNLEDRLRHQYIIGMTGTGKSKWMDMLALQDIKAGHGVCFIDPHGDDVEYIMSAIPKERAEDVIFFDPGDFDRPLAINMLEYDSPDQKIFAVNELLAIFDKLYDLKATGGPMFEQYMRNALILIMDDPESGSTLLEVPKVLADEEFRKMKLSKCTTQVVKDFWEKEAEKAGGEASLANMVPYITSKLTPFIANDLLRPIVSQQDSSFNFRQAMDSNKIILIKLAKGKIGDINANLLGMIVIGKILMAALGRSDMPEEERKPFFLYIDEFQNFLTESITVILSEARKYKLSLTIAHQFLGQLIVSGGDEKIKKAIFGNVGNKFAFRIGVEDAQEMAKEFSPVFNEYDFINAKVGTNFAKILIEGANPPPFNMKIPWVEDIFPSNKDIKEAMVQLSRLKYGRDRNIVEAEILERTRSVMTPKAAEVEGEDDEFEDLFK